MNRILTVTPMLALPILAYHFIVVSSAASGIDAALAGSIFSLPMLSGGRWTLTLSDIILVFGLAMLFIEIVRATSTRSTSLINHGVSTALLIFCLIEFLALRSFATSTFFLLMVMALLDVMAGFMVTIVSARRDFGVGDQISG